MKEASLTLGNGHAVHFYDRMSDRGAGLAVFWLHGTPNIGSPPAPLFAEADRQAIRWIGYDRPGYGGSTAQPGRNVASAALAVERIADHLGIDKFAVMGHSGGGPHALACAALLPDRVSAVASIAGLAPYGAQDLDWFRGMYTGGEAGLRAALAGRSAKAAYETPGPEYDPGMFSDADHDALAGPWAWFHSVVGPAVARGPGGLIDDDMAYVSPWGFDCAQIKCPVLLVQGEADRIVPASHGHWLAARCPSSELWLQPGAGHVSVMQAAPRALAWLTTNAAS